MTRALGDRGSEILGSESGETSNTSEHPRAELVTVVKGEHEVRPSLAREHRCDPEVRFTAQPMRSSAASTSRAFAAGQGSRGVEEIGDLGNRFPVLQAVGEDAQCEHFGFGERLFPRRPVRHHTGKCHDLGDPTPVVFALDLHDELAGGHGRNVPGSPGHRQDDVPAGDRRRY